MLKNIAIYIFYMLSTVFLLPSIVVYINASSLEENFKEKEEIIDNIEIVEQEEIKKEVVENNAFEDYIVGVVGAEMPISFEVEALKAQAVAARTYAYKRVDDINKPVDYKSIGQAYNSIEQMRDKWGANFDTYYKKVKDAVYSTKGEIMTYQNEPIEAVFHSTSDNAIINHN